MNYDDELSRILATARDVEHVLTGIGEFDLRFSFTNSHGHANALDRALAFEVERARVRARELVNGLAVNDLTFDRVRAIATDLARSINKARASALDLGCINGALEHSHDLATAINSALENALCEDSGLRPAVADGNDITWSTGRRNASNGRAYLIAGRSREKISPPVYAEYCLGFLVSPEFTEAVLGDFSERFNLTLTKHGVHLAKLEYWWQILRSIPGFLRIRLR
jgi:hypothetical protein